MKKVLLFLIDSMMPDVLERCVRKGKTPGFKFFMENGQYINDCVTVFPTMTASIDCSLITGVYPDQHKIPGLVWYDPDSNRVVNYINGVRQIIELGLEQCAHNVLYDLNERHLSKDVKTIHEELEERGFTAGSINVIAHRGHHKHKIHLPFVINMATGFRFREKLSGPTILSMGTLVKPAIFRTINWNWSHTELSSCGVNDAYAIDVLLEVLKSGKQPDFTLVYLPDNDHKLHKCPQQAEEHLTEVDEQIVRFLNYFDSWEQAVEKNVVIFISDHGQTMIGSTDEHNIDLDQLLGGLKISKLGKDITPEYDVVICNNERMSLLYPLSDSVQADIIQSVAVDKRIDVIAWKEQEYVVVQQGATDKRLSFKKGGSYQDPYGAQWTVKGDLDVLDLQIAADSTIRFDSYPDALSRLYGTLFSQEVPLIVTTAAPGYEFLSEYAPTHLGGGSHGSLHKQDSVIPLLIAGTDTKFPTPARLVDVKDFVMQEIMARLSPV